MLFVVWCIIVLGNPLTYGRRLMIKAVLFDMDGLLADTEPINMDVAARVCGGLEFVLSEAEKQKCIGVTIEKFYRELFESRNLDLSIAGACQEHNRIYEAILRNGVKDFPGAKSLPKSLKSRGFKLGLVSGSTKAQVGIVLSQLGILDMFDAIVSADDITKSKPDPEGFLLAAKKLGVLPEECVVLEDAEAGVKAGRAAGMVVVGVVNSGRQDLSLANSTVQDLTQVDIMAQV